MEQQDASERTGRDLDQLVSELMASADSAMPFPDEARRGTHTPDFDDLLRDQLKEHLRSDR